MVPVSRTWPASEDGPVIAVHAVENDGEKPLLILFTAADITKEDANQALKDAGFSALSKISECRELESIPLLGSGKTDYQTIVLY